MRAKHVVVTVIAVTMVQFVVYRAIEKKSSTTTFAQVERSKSSSAAQFRGMGKRGDNIPKSISGDGAGPPPLEEKESKVMMAGGSSANASDKKQDAVASLKPTNVEIVRSAEEITAGSKPATENDDGGKAAGGSDNVAWTAGGAGVAAAAAAAA
mmetsp:Transcript_40319/g.82503  ORF Transcript_40319/g.82503 Transcript_40319/m.82503 type:complete len:154 (+) Transcript_40319:622-1083(+)